MTSVVGDGIVGLSAAYRSQQHGYEARALKPNNDPPMW